MKTSVWAITLCRPEEWRPVVGFESVYQVSNLGNVRRTTKGGGQLAPIHRKRYLAFSLKDAPKKALWSAHKVVADAFIGPRPPELQVAHLNGDPQDNRAENLAYVTQSENEQHKHVHGTARTGGRHPLAKLADADVSAILESTERSSELAQRFGVNESAIRKIRSGERWRDRVSVLRTAPAIARGGA